MKSTLYGVAVGLLWSMPLHGQPAFDIGAYLSRHGVGFHAGAGVHRVSAFARYEGWSTIVQTAGARVRLFTPAEGAFTASIFGGRGSCPSVLIGERGTGCDDAWHTVLGGGLGVELLSGRRGTVFADVQRYHILDGSTDLPQWSFAAGYVYRLNSRRD